MAAAVDNNSLPDRNEHSAQLLVEYVQLALSSKGISSGAYRSFVQQVATLRKRAENDPTEADLMMLTNLLDTLKSLVSLFREKTHDALLSEILGIKLWNTTPMIRNAVLDFVSNLVVVNSAFTHTCLQLLVYSFLPPPSPPNPEACHGRWEPSVEELDIQSSILATLKKVLVLVPTAPSSLLQLVVQHMPHKLRDRNTQCMFLCALFSVAESPSGKPIRDSLLAAAVEHMLTIDVEIKWEDIVDVHTGEEEEEGESDQEEHEDIFELEGMSELDINGLPHSSQPQAGAGGQECGTRGGWEGAAAVGPHAAAAAASEGKPAVDETANKLDSMMELAFAHLHKRCHQHAHGPQHVWQTLLSIFDRTILNTHRSKFSQFLVFYMCSKHPDLCARPFVDFLLAKLKDQQQPSITRSACAAYVASFLARAAFISESMVISALEELSSFCHVYCANVTVPKKVLSRCGSSSSVLLGTKGSSAAQAEAENSMFSSLTAKHQVFYASIQAILYILCYHLEPLLQYRHRQTGSRPDCEEEAAQAERVTVLIQERLLPLLQHPLEPLNVCLPSVVSEFKNQVQSARIMDISKIAPPDEDLRRSQRPLEMFFPFDPYLLQRSAASLRLSSSYVRWRHGHPRATSEAQQEESCSDSDDDQEVGRECNMENEEELESEGSSSSSGSDSEDEGAMQEGSVPGDAMLHRPNALRRPAWMPGHRTTDASLLRFGPSKGMGLLDPHHDKRNGYDSMGASFSPTGYLGSSHDNNSPAANSPVVVDYQGLGVYGGSPMQLGTPPVHHMHACATKLALTNH